MKAVFVPPLRVCVTSLEEDERSHQLGLSLYEFLSHRQDGSCHDGTQIPVFYNVSFDHIMHESVSEAVSSHIQIASRTLVILCVCAHALTKLREQVTELAAAFPPEISARRRLLLCPIACSIPPDMLDRLGARTCEEVASDLNPVSLTRFMNHIELALLDLMGRLGGESPRICLPILEDDDGPYAPVCAQMRRFFQDLYGSSEATRRVVSAGALPRLRELCIELDGRPETVTLEPCDVLLLPRLADIEPPISLRVLAMQARRQRCPVLQVPLDPEVASNTPELADGTAGEETGSASKGETLVSEALRRLLATRTFETLAERVWQHAGYALPPTILPFPPEPSDLGTGILVPDSPSVVLYPDPELPMLDQTCLQRMAPGIRLATPSTLHRRLLLMSSVTARTADNEIATDAAEGRALAAHLFREMMLRNVSVAVTLSSTPQRKFQNGLQLAHEHETVLELVRTLAGHGGGVAYCGDRRESGYVARISRAIQAHNRSGAPPAGLLRLYLAPWAELGSVPLRGARVFPAVDAGPFLERLEAALAHWKQTSDTDRSGACRRAVDALKLTEVRKRMARECSARVCIGGKLVPRLGSDDGFLGRFPGVLEEAWLTLRENRPLYVVGGLGGAAEWLALRILATSEPGDHAPEEWDDAGFRAANSDFDALCTFFDPVQSGLEDAIPDTIDKIVVNICQKLHEFFQSDTAALTFNGLSRDENLRLLTTPHPLEIVGLVATGLMRHRMQSAAHGQPTLDLELRGGDLFAVGGVQSHTLMCLEDLPPESQVLGLDRRSREAIFEGWSRLRVPRTSRPDGPVDPTEPDVVEPSPVSEVLSNTFLPAGGSGGWVQLILLGAAREWSDDAVLRRVELSGRTLVLEASRLGLESVATLLPGASWVVPAADQGIWLGELLSHFLKGVLEARTQHPGLKRLHLVERHATTFRALQSLLENGYEVLNGLLEHVKVSVTVDNNANGVTGGAPKTSVLLVVSRQDGIACLPLLPGTCGAVREHRGSAEELSALLQDCDGLVRAPSAQKQLELARSLRKLLFGQENGALAGCAPTSSVATHPWQVILDAGSTALPYELLDLGAALPSTPTGSDPAPPVGDSAAGPALAAPATDSSLPPDWTGLPSLEGGLARILRVSSSAGHPVRHSLGSPLRILLVIDPTGDLEGARREGVWLYQYLARFRPALVVDSLMSAAAAGLALVDDFLSASARHFRQALDSGDYDVLHFCGHAQHIPGQPERSGLVLEQNRIVGTDALASITKAPRLVILNACESARCASDSDSSVKEMSLPSLAEWFLSLGTSCLIGTRWEVEDAAAHCFAETLYPKLLEGATFAHAMREVRRRLRRDGYADWCNYQLYAGLSGGFHA